MAQEAGSQTSSVTERQASIQGMGSMSQEHVNTQHTHKNAYTNKRNLARKLFFFLLNHTHIPPLFLPTTHVHYGTTPRTLQYAESPIGNAQRTHDKVLLPSAHYLSTHIFARPAHFAFRSRSRSSATWNSISDQPLCHS